ncbi:MAG TPA: Rne/Rng family ribonuclease [Gaiellaceae bacterium]|nr:Rne/Rng family ribonuclease [Gaiellaceae bacterium]
MPLSLFRRKKQEVEQAPQAAAAPTSAPELPIAAPANAPAADGSPAEGQATAPKKRRRGTRGGRGRKKPAGSTAAVATADAPAAAKSSTAAATKKPAERRGGSGSQRSARAPRRTAPKRAPLPKAKRELLISVDAGEKRVAVLEDDRVAEVYLERPEHRSIAGNVYLGTVDNVLPGMEAAFVEIGLEKNGFLYVDEIVGPELEGRKGARKIQDLIQRGQTILVQAVKDPMKTKGARLTTEISLPGRFVVFVPHGDGLGVSRRIEDEERNRLKAIVKEIAPKQGGVIVRTAAEGASADDIALDLDFLQRLWKTIEDRAKGTNAPALIYQEAELPLRVTRDLFTGDFERLLVDNDRAHKRIVGYLKKTSPHMVEKVVRYKDRPPLMEAFGVEHEIRSTLNRRVDLPSGGYLIFDYAEAFTVIDVNTGRFVGSRSKTSGARLEDTITKNNLEAVKEVVRQLRLRDVGGIIVIDFIDMANPKNRAAVEDALRTELERDRTKTYVVEISPLGLVEMTRQNVTDGPREVMTRKCPTCAGDGIIVSESTTALEIERQLRALVTPGSRAKAFKVEVNAKIAAMVVGPGAELLKELEETTKRQFFLVGLPDVHLDHFRVLDQGATEKVAPADAGVTVGQELELKLGEVGLYDPHAGVAKVKGTDVYVANAAKLVGKKVSLRVTAVMEGVAYAELLDDLVVGEPPITAEAEAEKPTRARRPAKKADTPTEDDAVEIELEDAEDAADELEDDPPSEPAMELTLDSEDAEPVSLDDDGEAVAGDAVATTPKKRTRRGSRGGKNRRKRPAGAAAAVAGEGAVAGEEPEADAADDSPEEAVAEPDAAETQARPAMTRGPVVHLPDADLGRDVDSPETGDQPAAVKKPTRRGSRGGRNRRKRPAGATAGSAAAANGDAPETPETVVSEQATEATTPVVEVPAAKPEKPDDAEAWEYTPMSQWDDVDEKAS